VLFGYEFKQRFTASFWRVRFWHLKNQIHHFFHWDLFKFWLFIKCWTRVGFNRILNKFKPKNESDKKNDDSHLTMFADLNPYGGGYESYEGSESVW
jgi:hypothetical protein